MLLKLCNLGRIRQADVEVKKLTVFVGENSVNKTWAAYCLHGLLRGLARVRGRLAYQDQSAMSAAEEQQLAAVLDGDSELATFAARHAPGLGARFDVVGIATHLGLPDSVLEPTAEVRVDIEADEFPNRVAEARVQYYRRQRRAVIDLRGVDDVSLGIIDVLNVAKPVEVDRAIRQNAFTMLEHAFALPAERKALLLSGLVNLTVAQGTTPAPWIDFVDIVALARATKRQGRLANLGGRLDELLGGDLLAIDEGGSARIAFQVPRGPAVPLHGASSAVRAIAGLTLYLDRLAQPGDFVVIDELEMNAHPRLQLALTELITEMVNADVRVLFTTHSPYIVDHLASLMLASRVPEDRQDELAAKFVLRQRAAFIKPEDVAVYEFRDDGRGAVAVESVLDEKRALVNWRTFSDQTNRMNAIYGDVLRAAVAAPDRAQLPRRAKAPRKAKK